MGLPSSLLAFATNILRIMILIVFVISKFLHILNNISNADDLGLIFYGSIGLCSRMACSMVAWYFWSRIFLERAVCPPHAARVAVSTGPAGSFVRSPILESHERCQRENDAWELHRSYFTTSIQATLAPPLPNIIFIGWDPKFED